MILFIGTGFTKNSSVVNKEYSLNEDVSKLNFIIGIPDSIGCTREYTNKGGGYELVLQKNIETGEWVRPNK